MLAAVPTPGLLEELTWRGLVHQTTDPALGARLDGAATTAYWGFDPTADSFTIGHLVGITMLMRLQRHGHRPIALAGGGTGLIGDPSGRSEERTLLADEELQHNLVCMRAQLERLLDFGSGGALLLDNSEWLGSVGLLDFLRDTGKHFTVNTMVAKDSVRSRLEDRAHGLSFTEFSYMLLQAYDFERLFLSHDCRLQFGGSDQWGSITAGIDLIRRRHGDTAYGLTHPLITKADGTKFGKTETGAIWLDPARTSPYAMQQFFVRTADDAVGTLIRYLTFRSREEIEALDASTRDDAAHRLAQRALAHDVVALVHGEDAAVAAERVASVLFSEDVRELDEPTLLDALAEAPSSDVARTRLGDVDVVDLLVESGLEPSRGRARTTVEQGGAYLNNRRVDSTDARLGAEDLLHDRYALLRKGKAGQHLLRVV